jgi:hypothetical protein
MNWQLSCSIRARISCYIYVSIYIYIYMYVYIYNTYIYIYTYIHYELADHLLYGRTRKQREHKDAADSKQRERGRTERGN